MQTRPWWLAVLFLPGCLGAQSERDAAQQGLSKFCDPTVQLVIQNHASTWRERAKADPAYPQSGRAHAALFQALQAEGAFPADSSVPQTVAPDPAAAETNALQMIAADGTGFVARFDAAGTLRDVDVLTTTHMRPCSQIVAEQEEATGASQRAAPALCEALREHADDLLRACRTSLQVSAGEISYCAGEGRGWSQAATFCAEFGSDLP